MREDYTEVILVIDESGSMGGYGNIVDSGIKEFIQDQQAAEGLCKVTLVTFSGYEVKMPYVAIDANEFPEYKHRAQGGTPLNDALGTAITTAGRRFSLMNEEDRPSKVIVVVQTDGFENTSKEFSQKAVKDLIAEHEGKYSWQFVFLGADIDAQGIAGGYGIAPTHTVRSAGIHGMCASLDVISKNVVSYRAGSKADMSYTQEDIDKINS